MFGFGKKENNTKGPVEYGNEFRVAFENQDMQKMMIITEKWLKDCPRDANANYAYGVVLGLLAIMGNLEKSEALKRMDLIAKGALLWLMMGIWLDWTLKRSCLTVSMKAFLKVAIGM